jgi:hypothetical protein
MSLTSRLGRQKYINCWFWARNRLLLGALALQLLPVAAEIENGLHAKHKALQELLEEIGWKGCTDSGGMRGFGHLRETTGRDDLLVRITR